jgi:fibro-slime domain-containing protein
MHRLAVIALALGAAACSLDTQRGEVGVYQAPASAGAGAGGSLTAPGPDTPAFFLVMFLRDFKQYDAKDPSTNPAFDNVDSEKSVVDSTLGPDRKPVYRPPSNDLPSYGQAAFDQWYHDVPGTNYTVPYPLPIARGDDGLYEYDSQKSGKPDTYLGVDRRVFFPLDDGDPYATPFGNQGSSHNHAFTGELHAGFTAVPGATLQVRADDDLYLFIDGKLVIDLGGTHSAITRELELDSLSLSADAPYRLDLFYAERRGATGDLMLKTSLELTRVID